MFRLNFRGWLGDWLGGWAGAGLLLRSGWDSFALLLALFYPVNYYR